jgi:hypothetical protein
LPPPQNVTPTPIDGHPFVVKSVDPTRNEVGKYRRLGDRVQDGNVYHGSSLSG